ncbi:polysaccharide lyase 8 family protein [Nonomuraea longicatena]|uniref:Polysaccharide lyase 8 family protein n=2 Tax=Nonomuraea longicatena TaxID=83682 RepID=A0ABP3Z7U6_9ACTN
MSRRSLLGLGELALLPGGAAAPLNAGPLNGALSDDGDLARIGHRWRALATRPGTAAVRAIAPTATSLWPDLPYPSYTETPARLLAMARTGDPALADPVARGIEHYVRHVYTPGASADGNWWNWRIGIPRRLLEAALLIGPSRADRPLVEAVDHFVHPCHLAAYEGHSTAANRVDLCQVMLLRAVVGADPARAALAASALTPVFPYVSEGDGLYRDGTFIQHSTVPYQGGYGRVLLSGLATLFAVLRGTRWATSDQRVFDLVEKSFAPFMHDGFCMDLVSGRGIGRHPYGDRRRGREVAQAVLLLGESASPAERTRWRGLVRGWGFADLAPEAETVEPAEGHRLMAMSARAVHRRREWVAGLSMASYRIAHYEHGNGENLRGWHTGAGMLYWWARGHREQYSDHFWQSVDPYRLPGTTVSTLRLPDGAGAAWGGECPPARWVGGATDGHFACVGQHLYGLGSTLEAFKSWFFLDDAVLCLGAGIRCADGVPVETIVDNRRTDAALTLGGGWAHLAGHGGYVVDGPLRTLREERGTVRRAYTTLWLDHGTDPDAASYRYLLLPGASPELTRARAADPGWVDVLANTDRGQGVSVASAGLTAVNFWQPGTVGPLTASAPCAVLVRERGDGTATLTVADPRRDLDGLTVTWDRPVAAVVRGHPLLTRARTGRRLTLRWGRLADRGGSSKTVVVRLQSAK